MRLAVIDYCPHIHNRKPCQTSCLQGSLYSLLARYDEWSGYGTADNLIYKLKARSPRKRFYAHPYLGELSRAAVTMLDKIKKISPETRKTIFEQIDNSLNSGNPVNQEA